MRGHLRARLATLFFGLFIALAPLFMQSSWTDWIVDYVPLGPVVEDVVSDTEAPAQPTFTASPSSSGTNENPVTFSWSSVEAGATYQCQMDGSAWATCTSPKVYSTLSSGFHNFGVRAKDTANNIGVARTRGFTIGSAEVACSGTNIDPTDNVATIVNNAPSPTKFCLTSSGNYNITSTVKLMNGDSLKGPVGASTTRGPATYGLPTATIDANHTASSVISVQGSNVSISWIGVTGADGKVDLNDSPSNCPASDLGNGCPIPGTGVGISMGQSNGTAKVSNVHIHHNDAVGIGNAHGQISNCQTNNNTEYTQAFLGVTGSGIKGVTEFEIDSCYIHDEQGNGGWLDHSLSTGGNDSAMSGNPNNGGWFHNTLSVNNGRKGLRYEYSPRDARDNHLSTPSIMIEDNSLHGNADEGVSVRDAQNAIVRNNQLGSKTISGVAYSGNSKGVLVSDSMRSDRTDTMYVTVSGNTLNGDDITCNVENNAPQVNCQ